MIYPIPFQSRMTLHVYWDGLKTTMKYYHIRRDVLLTPDPAFYL